VGSVWLLRLCPSSHCDKKVSVICSISALGSGRVVMHQLRAIERVEGPDDAERLKRVVETLAPAPEVLQHLLAIEDASSGENKMRVAGIIEDYARRYETLLTPLYHIVPWGDLIVDRERFLQVYERTRELLPDFRNVTADEIARILQAFPCSLMVFRLMTGYSWNELSDIVRTAKAVAVSGPKIRSIESSPGCCVISLLQGFSVQRA